MTTQDTKMGAIVSMYRRYYITDEDRKKEEFRKVKEQISILNRSTAEQESKIEEWSAKIVQSKQQIREMHRNGTSKTVLYSQLKRIIVYEKLLDRMLNKILRLSIFEINLRSIWLDKTSIDELKKCIATINSIRPEKIVIDVDELSDKSTDMTEMFKDITGAMGQLTDEMAIYHPSSEEGGTDDDYDAILKTILGAEEERHAGDVIIDIQDKKETKNKTIDPLISTKQENGSTKKIPIASMS